MGHGPANYSANNVDLRSARAQANDAECIGCGCTDSRACDTGLGVGCSWIIVDRKAKVGVCSQCRTHVPRWQRGDREKQGGAK